MSTTPTKVLPMSTNSMGQLCWHHADNSVEIITAVRAFPIGAPQQGIALVNQDGKEVCWLTGLEDLSEHARALIEADLAGREFMPEIQKLCSVSTFATPSTWEVETNRGRTSFVLKGEEDIRRLAPPSLLITDSHGIHFLIRDMRALDKHSKKLLDRFF